MKKISKTITLVLIALLILMPLSNVQAAQEIKISKSSLTLNVGQIRRLTISNVTTVKWKTSDKSVATVSSKGNVKAIAEGTATITGTANKKSYTCEVTILPKILTDDEKMKNISYNTIEANNSLIVICKNDNNSYNKISALMVDILFYDESDKLIFKTNKKYHFQLSSGKEFITAFEYPKENNAPYNLIKFSSYKVNIEPCGTINYKYDISDQIKASEAIYEYTNYYNKTMHGDVAYYISITEDEYNNRLSQYGEYSVAKDQRKRLDLSITNDTENLISNLQLYIIYYKDNKIVNTEDITANSINIGVTTLENTNVYQPNNYGYKSYFENTDNYDRFEIFLNHAYVGY